MEESGPEGTMDSKEFGDITVSYSYNWDVHGKVPLYPYPADYGNQIENRKPLQQSGAPGSRYLVISCVPTEKSRDPRNNVNNLTEEFYGISPSDKEGQEKPISFGYVSYHSLGNKMSSNDDLKEQNGPHGYSFPQSNLVANKNASVFTNNR